MGWLKVNVKVTGPTAAVVLVPVIATVGARGAVPDAEPPPPPQPRNRGMSTSIDRRSFIFNDTHGLNGDFPQSRFHSACYFLITIKQL
jgi:hypothetical protein